MIKNLLNIAEWIIIGGLLLALMHFSIIYFLAFALSTQVAGVLERATRSKFAPKQKPNITVILHKRVSVYYQTDINYQDIDSTKISILKAIRTLSPDITLKDAVEIRAYISNRKCTLVAGIPIETANHIQTTFAKIGVEVEVKKSSIESSMLLFPNAGSIW